MSWPTTTYNGVGYYLFDGVCLIPIDASTGAPILMLKANGFAVGSGIPAIEDGADGAAATFQEGPIAFTELAYNDPTPASLTVTEVSPGVFAVSGALHAGAPGAAGTTAINLSTIGGTAAAGKLIKVNTGATGFDYMFEKVAERYVPASISNTASGNTNSTLMTIAIPNKHVDCRIFVAAHTIVTQDGGSDVRVNLRARLGTESSGNIIAECPGISGTERLVISSAPPAGAADSFDKIPAESGTVNVYIRTEQQSGSNSYTTSNSTTRGCAWAIPVG